MKSALFYYCLILVILLTLGSAFSAQTSSVIPLILILPITVYFMNLTLVRINQGRIFPLQKLLNTFGVYYGFIVVAVMTISGFFGAKNIPQLLSGIIFLPLAGYFILRVLPKRRRAIHIPAIVLQPTEINKPKKQVKIDIDRRQFLKLISSAGLSLFLFSIFAKKAEAAFFGSVPGPGTVALKDTAGVQIDPAIKTPTDGYKITQIDDTTPAYYGFVEKNGAWFIMKEDSSGNYRYTKGASSFSANWTNRATLTYDLFDVVF